MGQWKWAALGRVQALSRSEPVDEADEESICKALQLQLLCITGIKLFANPIDAGLFPLYREL